MDKIKTEIKKIMCVLIGHDINKYDYKLKETDKLFCRRCEEYV